MSEQQINDGGPAFPNESDSIANPDGGLIKLRDYGLQGHPGMSLRAYYAGKALEMVMATETAQAQLETAIRERYGNFPEEDRRKIAREIIANRCVLQADALIAALNERPQP